MTTSAALGAIWLASAAATVASPDMVSGSEHEHLPLVGITIWLWTLTSTGYVLLAARGTASQGFTVAVVTTWLAVLVVTIFGPVMVTGTDPTRIPIAALLAPAAGTLATGFLAISEARLSAGRPPSAPRSTVRGRRRASA